MNDRPAASPSNSRHHQRGLTLFELLTVLAIVGITITLGLPGFRDTIRNERLVTTANELLVSLNLARSTAITTRRTTSICATDNPEDDQPSCIVVADAGDPVNWESGWLVFTDLNANRQYEPPDDVLWEVHPPLVGNVSVSTVGALRLGTTFRIIGTPRQFGTFDICDDRRDEPDQEFRMREVVLSIAGRAIVEQGDGGTC